MGKQQAGGQPVQRVELTAKHWKFLQLLGAIILAPGVLILVGAAMRYSQDRDFTTPLIVLGAVGVVLTLVGGGIYARGRFGAWWYHG